ncbi:MAG: HYR domain-containing protein [Candidatus Hydrogenedentes bacterium]|nr:HYR domain-containing protein [Candidatus Hydrogenedentota bacterium]
MKYFYLRTMVLMLACMLISVSGMAQVQFLSAASLENHSNSDNMSLSVTVPAGTTLLVAGVSNAKGTTGTLRNVDAVRLGGSSGTLFTKAINSPRNRDARAELWYLPNPPAGATTVYAKLNGSNSWKGMGVLCLKDVNLSRLSNAVTGLQSGYSPDASYSFTGTEAPLNSMIVSCIGYNSGDLSVTGTGHVQRWNEKATYLAKNSRHGGSTLMGTGSAITGNWNTPKSGALSYDWEMVELVVPGYYGMESLSAPALSVNDADPNNTVVGTFTAVDKDGVGSYTWTLPNNAGGRFKLAGGTGLTMNLLIADTTLIDRGQASSYTVRVGVRNTVYPTVFEKDFTITVNDTTKPAARCKNATVKLSSPTLSPTQVDNGSSDNVGITSRLINNQSSLTFTCAHLGANSVTLSVKDAAGNTDSCTSTVTVEDDIDPVITTLPDAVYTVVADATSGTAPAPDLTAALVATDNCGIASVTQSPTIGTALSIGSTPVTLTVTDVGGNTAQCGTSVKVVDQTPPVISVCPADRTVSAGAACMFSAPDLRSEVTATDNSGSCIITQFPNINANLAVGNTTFTFTATDGSGNTSTCQAAFTVEDDVPPVITLKGSNPQIVAVGAAYVESGATALDNCEGQIGNKIVINSQVNTSVPGSYSVIYTVTDYYGNDAVPVTRTVKVQDNTAPVAICKDIDVYLSAPQITPVNVDDGSYDNVGITSRLINNQSSLTFTCADLGANSVTLSVEDAAGNTDSCTSTVTVIDDIDPVITTLPNAVYTVVADATSGTAPAPDLRSEVTATDNCGTVSVTQSPAIGATLSIGSTPVTLTVTDTSGNTAQCGTSIKVEDQTAPVAICKDIDVYLSAPEITPADVDDGSYDNYQIAARLINGSSSISFGVGDVGA